MPAIHIDFFSRSCRPSSITLKIDGTSIDFRDVNGGAVFSELHRALKPLEKGMSSASCHDDSFGHSSD